MSSLKWMNSFSLLRLNGNYLLPSGLLMPRQCLSYCHTKSLLSALLGRRESKRCNRNRFLSSSSNALYQAQSSDLNIANQPEEIDQQHTEEPSRSRSEHGVLSLDDIYQFIIDENGRDVVVIHLSKSVNYVKYFIVVTANSSRHLAYLSESLNRLYKQRKSKSDPFRLIEGKGTAKDWQCIDLGNAVVHFMLSPVREKYQLEKLWLLGPKYDDHTRETPSLKQVFEQESDNDLFLLSDKGGSSEFVDDVQIVNPWEFEYDKDNDNSKLWEEDEDAYII